MSITRAVSIACSACGVELRTDVVDSLNAGRHPHLRERLLARRLHRFVCGACEGPISVDKEVVYVDFDRGQLFVAAPDAERGSGREAAWVEAAAGLFTRWLRDRAPSIVRREAGTIAVRLCFGLEELREKVVVDDARLDDRVVEAVKAALMVAEPRLEAAGVAALSLDGIEEDGALRFVAMPTALFVRVEAAVYARVAAAGDATLAMYSDGPWCSVAVLERRRRDATG
jgi:hypothetical protein